jgi:predicted nucleic acid-binding protein
MTERQSVLLDSCVVIDIIEKPKVASRLKSNLRGKSVNIVLCDVVLDEVRHVRGLMPQVIVQKITQLLGKKVQLDIVTEEHKAQALQLTEQFQICHNGDNNILSLCKARDFILVTFDKMLLKASQFVGIAVFSPFTAGGI